MSRWLDPVAVVRDAVTAHTGIPTTRVLDVSFTSGPLPLAHVSLVSTDLGDIDRVSTVSVSIYATTPSGPGQEGAQALADELLSAVDGRPLETPSGFVDGVMGSQDSDVRPYFEAVEVVPVTIAITYRPTS